MMTKDELVADVVMKMIYERLITAIKEGEKGMQVDINLSNILEESDFIYGAYKKGLEDGRKEAEEYLSSRPVAFGPLMTGNNTKPSKIGDTQAKPSVPVYHNEIDDIFKKQAGLNRPYKKRRWRW
jgi:hypothetical protein